MCTDLFYHKTDQHLLINGFTETIYNIFLIKNCFIIIENT